MVAFFFKYSNYFIDRVTWARHATTRPYLCSGPCWLLNRTFFRWRRTYGRIRPGLQATISYPSHFYDVSLRDVTSNYSKRLKYRKRLCYEIWNWAASRSLIDGNGSSLILFLLVSIFTLSLSECRFVCSKKAEMIVASLHGL